MLKLPGRAFKTKKSAPDVGANRRALLELRPIRNPALTWEEDNGTVVLHIAHKDSNNSRGWKARLAAVFINLPQERSVELDAIGTDVWKLLDGVNTVGAIVKILAKKHRLNARETELSLHEYFKELNRRGYIAFIKDEIVASKS